ncbi:50S ribosomal protein L13 [Patescibacteria group bacterium]|nr:50S ribosomal protein L13 [Patescibacteria group bacterium]
MKTYVQKPAEVKRQWHLVDVKGRVLGQVATEISQLLMGKNKPTFTPNVDGGDYVVVVNAKLVEVTGNKPARKMYYQHSHLPGGISEATFVEMIEKKPGEVIERAVYNMLPKNKLRAERMARLKVYADTEHKHHSQLGNK